MLSFKGTWLQMLMEGKGEEKLADDYDDIDDEMKVEQGVEV